MKMAEASDISIPENVKKLVRAVLLSKIGGVPLKKFPTDYKALIGENFPMLSLGFSSLLACMKAMPDVVRIIGDNEETCTLLGIGDETSFMSGPAIRAQFPVDDNQQKRQRGRKRNGTKKEKPPKNPPKNQMDQKGPGRPPVSEKYPDLVPNMQGLYAVVVKGIHDTYTADIVNNLFSLKAVVINQSHCNSFYFFRFATLHEAEMILDHFNGNMVNGTRIAVMAAQEKGNRINRNKSSSLQDKEKNPSPGYHINRNESSSLHDKERNPSPGHHIDRNKSSSLHDKERNPSLGHHIDRNKSSSLHDKERNPSPGHHIDRNKSSSLHDKERNPSPGHHIDRNKSSSLHDKERNPSPGDRNGIKSSQSFSEKSRTIIKTVNAKGDEKEKKMDRNGDKGDEKKNFHKKMNGRDKTNEKRRGNASNEQMRLKHEKQLPAQLEVIERTPSLPKLSCYGIHLDNINKSMTQSKLLSIFGRFRPTMCQLGRPSPKRTHVHAYIKFTCLEDVKEVSEYLKQDCIMGEQIISHFSFQTVKKLGLDLEEMGFKTVEATLNSKSSKSTNDDDWDEIDSTSDPKQCTEISSQSNQEDSSNMNMESLLKSLPNGVQNKVLPASDSEGSTTCSTRRRRPCILDFLEDETT